jgi:hypothetical protein
MPPKQRLSAAQVEALEQWVASGAPWPSSLSRTTTPAGFAEPTFLVVRSLDGRPIASSGRLRFYRGFGDRRIRWDGGTLDVDVELMVTKNNP